MSIFYYKYVSFKLISRIIDRRDVVNWVAVNHALASASDWAPFGALNVASIGALGSVSSKQRGVLSTKSDTPYRSGRNHFKQHRCRRIVMQPIKGGALRRKFYVNFLVHSGHGERIRLFGLDRGTCGLFRHCRFIWQRWSLVPDNLDEWRLRGLITQDGSRLHIITCNPLLGFLLQGAYLQANFFGAHMGQTETTSTLLNDSALFGVIFPVIKPIRRPIKQCWSHVLKTLDLFTMHSKLWWNLGQQLVLRAWI